MKVAGLGVLLTTVKSGWAVTVTLSFGFVVLLPVAPGGSSPPARLTLAPLVYVPAALGLTVILIGAACPNAPNGAVLVQATNWPVMLQFQIFIVAGSTSSALCGIRFAAKLSVTVIVWVVGAVPWF